MGNSQSTDAGAQDRNAAGGGGGGGAGLRRFHTGASQDGARRSPSPSMLRRASTAGANEQPRYGGAGTSSKSSSGTTSPRIASSSTKANVNAAERDKLWSRSANNTMRRGADGYESPSPLGPTSSSRSRSRSESISALLGGAKEGKRREATSGGAKMSRRAPPGELAFQRKRSIDINDAIDHDALTPISGPSTPSGTLPMRRATAPTITPVTFDQDIANWSPMPGMPLASATGPISIQSQQQQNQGSSDGGPSRDPLGRMQPAALPSYLKIPTLIPSAYASPNPSTPSSPSAHDDVQRWSDDVLGTSGSTTGSTAARRAGGTAAAAILNTEDVVILPGTASKVSSPDGENMSGDELAEPKTPTSATTNLRPSPQSLGKAELAEDGTAAQGENKSSAASRTSTPVPDDFEGARAITPTGRRSDGLSSLTTVSDEGGQKSRAQGAKLYMGSESGANTPAFPQSSAAPPSATTKPDSIPSMQQTTSDEDQEQKDPTTPTPGSSTSQRQDPNLRIEMPPSQSVRSMRAAASSAHARGSSLTPTNRHSHGAPPVMTPRDNPLLMPIVVTWRGGGKEVFVTGTFANEWRAKILLKRSHHIKNQHSCVLHLPPGTHRLKFIVDDRWRVSRDLSTAVDGEGNLTNYIEVAHLGPAHPGPLSAPGEDLIEDEREAQRRRRQGASVTSKRDSPLTTPKVPSNELELRPDTSPQTPLAASSGAAESSASTSDARAGGMRRSLGPTLDLLEEARRAEALRRGDLLEVFGEEVSAKEVWTQEIPESIISAQAREEAIRTEQENSVGASESPSSAAATRRRRSRSHDGSAAAAAQEDGDGADVDERYSHRRSSSNAEADLPAPPALPRQLEKVILNSGPAAVPKAQSSVDDNSVLPAPNHAVLHHLTASAIKSGVIATGCTTRYRKKYITTIYYRAAS